MPALRNSGRVKFRRTLVCAVAFLFCEVFPLSTAAQTIARDWDEQCLSAIRADTPHPPAQARNLFSLSVCMYDAWAAYDNVAVSYIYHGKHAASNLLAARNEAISYAAPVGCALRFNTFRGLYYKLQSAPDLVGHFVDV